MERLARWIECYIDCDNADERRATIANRLEYKKKIQLKKELLDKAERILDKRFFMIEHKQLTELKEYADPKMDYQKKVNYIEYGIERDFEYFGGNLDQNTFKNFLHQIRKRAKARK